MSKSSGGGGAGKVTEGNIKRCAACNREFRACQDRREFCTEACRQALTYWRQRGVARLRAARAVLLRRVGQLQTIDETLTRNATSGSCQAAHSHPTIHRETTE